MKELIRRASLNLVTNSYLFFTVSLLVSMYLMWNDTSIYIFYFKVGMRTVAIFLHEISHGLVALLSGFEIVEFKMHWSSGHVMSSQPVNAVFLSGLVAFAGYAGTTVFGLMLFLSSIKYRRYFMGLIIAIGVYFTFYYRDLETLYVMVYILLFFAFCALDYRVIDYVLRFAAAFLMIQSVIAPFHQLKIAKHSDSTALVKMFGFSESFYVALWASFSILVIIGSFLVLRRQNRKADAVVESYLGSYGQAEQDKSVSKSSSALIEKKASSGSLGSYRR